MKILFVGDIHFKDVSSIPQFNKISQDTGLPVELERAVKSLKWIEQVIEEHRPDLVIQLGDVFHTIGQISSRVLIEAVRSFNSLHSVCNSIGAEFYILGGNHDIDVNYRYTTECLPCDKHFSQPEVYNDLYFVPYLDPEYEMWRLITSSDEPFIITHTQVKGVHYSFKRKSNEGLDVSKIESQIVSGHIHIPQVVGNVYYTGSLYQNIPSEQPLNISFGCTIYDDGEFIQLENTSVKKLAQFYIKEVENIPENIDDYYDNYVLKIFTSNQEVIDFFKQEGFDFYVAPYFEEKVKKELIKDTEIKPVEDIILSYIKEPYLKKYIKKYIEVE